MQTAVHIVLLADEEIPKWRSGIFVCQHSGRWLDSRLGLNSVDVRYFYRLTLMIRSTRVVATRSYATCKPKIKDNITGRQVRYLSWIVPKNQPKRIQEETDYIKMVPAKKELILPLLS